MVEYMFSVLDVVPQPRWELYRVLSEPVRLRLLALAAEEELAIGELAELLGESQPNVSRHVAPLRAARLLAVRRDGTRTLVRFVVDAAQDPVVADALASGHALCEADGSLGRVAEVLGARDALAREFFARPRRREASKLPSELPAYLAALAMLLPRRRLAVDAGTGDGGLLDVLAPAFERVLAIDRSEVQLELARERLLERGYSNVTLLATELDGAEVRDAVGPGGDVVFASRMLHHAPKPKALVQALADLCAPGGALVVLDYARHEEEAMRAQADLWLGFSEETLLRFASAAGLARARVLPIAPELRGRGPDAHLPWQAMVARKSDRVLDVDPRPRHVRK